MESLTQKRFCFIGTAFVVLFGVSTICAQSDNLERTERDEVIPYMMWKTIPPFIALEMSLGWQGTRELNHSTAFFYLHQPDALKSFAVFSIIQASMLMASPQLRFSPSIQRLRNTLAGLAITSTFVSEMSQSLLRGASFDMGDFSAGLIGAISFYAYDKVMCQKLLKTISSPSQNP